MNDTDFCLKIKQLMALTFVSVPREVKKFDKLMFPQPFVNNKDLLLQLIDYFEETWNGRLTRIKYTTYSNISFKTMKPI